MASSSLEADLNDESFLTAPQASDDYANPWESAANDDQYRTSRLRLNASEPRSPDVRPAASSSHQHASFKVRLIWCNQIWDGFLGSLLSIWTFFQIHALEAQDEDEKNAATLSIMLISALLALVLVLRSTLGGRFLYANMRSRLWVVFLFLVKSGVLFFATKKHDLLPWFPFLKDHSHVAPIAMVVLAVLEFIQFFLLRYYYYSEEEALLNQSASYSMSSQTPWWWAQSPLRRRRHRNENLEEPLLDGQPSWTFTSNDYQMQDGINSSGGSSWWPFSRPLARDNARDDGSVDYASLNEDWASRSETDPYWWTREVGER
jgi:hypothetical protein